MEHVNTAFITDEKVFRLGLFAPLFRYWLVRITPTFSWKAMATMGRRGQRSGKVGLLGLSCPPVLGSTLSPHACHLRPLFPVSPRLVAPSLVSTTDPQASSQPQTPPRPL